MNNQSYVYLTNALAVSCVMVAIIFIALPIPKKVGLKNYRISLRILFVAYITSAFIALVDKVLVNVLSMIFLSICSFLILLFSIALINLIHPERVNRKFVLLHISPLAIVNLIYWSLVLIYGNPMLESLSYAISNIFHIQIFIRVIVWFACAVQLIYFILVFQKEVRQYNDRLDGCFSENYKLHLPWVRFCYYSALLLGVYALIISLVSSPVALMTFYTSLTVFFVVFGACYIQYPRTYVKIEPLFEPVLKEKSQIIRHRYSWNELKKQVIENKYYMEPGINIEDLSQFLKIGRTTLSSFINKEEGMNFNAWIGSLRIEEAIRMFREDHQYSISQVSEMVGYSEPSNFSRQFKSVTGISPSEWYRQENVPV